MARFRMNASLRNLKDRMDSGVNGFADFLVAKAAERVSPYVSHLQTNYAGLNGGKFYMTYSFKINCKLVEVSMDCPANVNSRKLVDDLVKDLARKINNEASEAVMDDAPDYIAEATA